MATLTTAQRNLVIEALTYDKNYNYSRLEWYLKQIISGQNVEFVTRSDSVIVLPTAEAWDLIAAWGADESVGLPIGDRGSMHARARRLLSYIETNVSGKSAEAAANYRLILEQAEKPLIQSNEVVTDPVGLVLQRAYELRRKQIKLLQDGLIGKLTTNLEKTKFLQSIPDAPTRVLVMQMIAASNINFRVPSDFTPEKINQLLLHEPGYKQLNNAIHLAYSRASKQDLQEISKTIDQTIEQEYHGNEAKYRQDMEMLRNLGGLAPSVSDIDWMVDHVASGASPQERARLSNALRSVLTSSARGGHLDGDALLKAALIKAGLPVASAARLESLAPHLEEIEIKQRHKLLGATIADKQAHLVATASLTSLLGVDIATPWLSQTDLTGAAKVITDKYGVNTLVEAYTQSNDLHELAEIKNLMGMISDRDRYRSALRASPLRALQDAWAKTWHQPVSPGRFSILDPFRGLSNRWVGFQTGIAVNIHDWAINVPSGSWFSGFAGHVADFSEGFIKHKADWTGAKNFFIERKWGNILDQVAKKAGHESWGALKKSSAQAIAKSAQAFGNKIAAGLGDKIVTALGTITSEAGIGLLILGAHVLWQLGKEALTKAKKLISSVWNGNSDNLFGAIPLALGGALLVVNAVLLGIPGAIYITYKVLVIIIKELWDSLVTLFTLATAVALIIVAGFAFLYYVFVATINLDSGSSQLVDIVCNLVGAEAPSTSSNPRLAAGKCVYQLLTQFGINPLVAGNATGAAFASYASALGNAFAASETQRSATSYGSFQCSGFNIVVDILTGGAGNFSNANLLSTIVPTGYRFVSGVASCSPGDYFVDTTFGTFGHTGLFVEHAGANIVCLDANSDGGGLVRDETTCRWPTANVAGCLKSN